MPFWPYIIISSFFGWVTPGQKHAETGLSLNLTTWAVGFCLPQETGGTEHVRVDSEG